MQNRVKKYLNRQRKAKHVFKQEEHYQTGNELNDDFIGFPHGQSKENIAVPSVCTEIKASTAVKTGSENISGQQINEAASDASGSAFDATEEVRE